MKRILLILAALLFSATAHAENGRVVVTIKPLHSLVAAVMQGDGNEPVLLVDGKTSLHSFSLRPSQMQSLRQAAIVFYIGDGLETFLNKTLTSLPKELKRAPMEGLSALTLHYARPESGEVPDDDHHHEGRDLHIWLMPANAKAMVSEIARQLSMAFPENKALYQQNARIYANRIDQLDYQLEHDLTGIRYKPFVVFHDAYQYFAKRYQLQERAALTLHPERGLNAKHVGKVREIIKSSGAICVFSEPQFDQRVMENLLEGTEAKSGVLDPEGALFAPGPELYFELMRGLGESLKKCMAS
jgi:zinc transport system substrate-binding protein